MTDQKFEIPDSVREMAERNVEQARTAYSQFVEMARKAQDVALQSSQAMTSSAQELQAKTLSYAEQNVDASFAFATDLAKARDLKEYVEIQQRYAKAQMESFAEQAQDLNRLMSEAAQKAQPKS